MASRSRSRVTWCGYPHRRRGPGCSSRSASRSRCVGASRARRWRAPVVVGLALAIAAVIAHVIGGWGASAATVAGRLGESIYALGGIGLAAVALVLLITRDEPSDATPALLMAGLVLALGSGLADVTVLWHSQLPSTQPASLVRLEVVAALGLGVGLAAAGALRLRPTRELARRPERLPA